MTTPSPETLIALAGTVAALGTRVGLLSGQVDGKAERGHLDALRAEFDALAGIVSGVLEAENPRGPAAIDWTRLDDAERKRAMADLSEWVTGVLMPSYPSCGLRDCWPNHPQAVIELSNIWQEWRHAYHRKRPDLALALSWHDRWMPGALARIEVITRNCLTGCKA